MIVHYTARPCVGNLIYRTKVENVLKWRNQRNPRTYNKKTPHFKKSNLNISLLVVAHFTHLGWSQMLKPFLTDYDHQGHNQASWCPQPLKKSLTKVGQMKVIPNSRKKYLKNKLGPLSLLKTDFMFTSVRASLSKKKIAQSFTLSFSVLFFILAMFPLSDFQVKLHKLGIMIINLVHCITFVQFPSLLRVRLA